MERNDSLVQFGWNDKTYEVAYESIGGFRIVLPSGTLLEVVSVLESDPPVIEKLEEVNHVLDRSDPAAIAVHMNGVVAVQIGG